MTSTKPNVSGLDDAPPVGRRILLNYIEDTATQYPNQPAVYQLASSEDPNIDEDREILLTYSDIISLVNKICWQLHNDGVKSGSSHTIAYLGPSDLRHLLISLAATRMGNQALLISPRASISTVQSLTRQSNAPYLICDYKFTNVGKDISEELKNVRILTIAGILELIRKPLTGDDYPYDGSWNSLCTTPATIVHTTGSTGNPKLVSISHATLAATDAHRIISQNDPQGEKCQLELLAKARTVFVAFPLFHVAGFNLCCYLLFSGVALMLGYPDQPPNTLMLHVALRHHSLDGALLPPSLVEELSHDSVLMEKIEKLSWIFTGGGSITQEAGDTVVTKTRLFNGLGSTECGSFIQYPTDPSNWNYFHFHPLNGIDWRLVTPKTDGMTVECELVIIRDRSCEVYQSVFHNFPELEEWSTKDVFRKHATIENLWEYGYRIDDTIVFSSGEKMNPIPLERRLSRIPGIRAGLAIGNKQRYPGLLLEIEDPDQNCESYLSLPSTLREDIQDVLKQENAKTNRDGFIHESMILIAGSGKPFIRTPKGTVHRNMTLDDYKAEIRDLYHSMDLSTAIHSDQAQISLTSEVALASDLAKLVTQITSNAATLTTDDDFFAAGFDSGQAQILTAVINKQLASQGNEGDFETVPTLDVSIIYANSTPQKLSRYILRKSSSLGQNYEAGEKFDQLLQRYLSYIPTSNRVNCETATGKHILVTGTTGFIGSHTVNSLLRRREVARVTCLDRKSTVSRTRSPKLAMDGNATVCEYVEADLAEHALGLPDSLYGALLGSVTDILHCQWAVDFHRPLDYFEKNIEGVSHLIRFACNSKHNAQIIFLSSVATVKNWQKPEPVPEVKLTSPEFAVMGYGQSKLIACLLLDRASETVNVPTTICRLGQVTGPVAGHSQDHVQLWPRRDWFPTLLTASIRMASIPDSLGAADQIDWIPVDLVAEALSDLVCNTNVSRGEASDISQSKYYHFVNPARKSYTDFVPFLAKKLGKEEALKIVSLREWVALLANEAQGKEAFESSASGISLLGFFQSLISSDRSPPPLDTKLTESQLPRFRDVTAVSEEWMEMWLNQWGLI